MNPAIKSMACRERIKVRKMVSQYCWIQEYANEKVLGEETLALFLLEGRRLMITIFCPSGSNNLLGLIS